jgi:NAD(P)-dependent dehydrogenase (short-subunit alcohol dehydrogenase family)
MLAGKVALVTGGAQGLGAVFAEALACEGASVVVGDIADATEICGQITRKGGRSLGVPLDVTSAASVEACTARCVEAFGGLHILVNNAGLFTNIPIQPFDQITTDAWDRVMSVNVRGVFECAKGVSGIMRAQRYGKIINIASGTAIKGTPGLLHYVASKGAVISMTRALARELGDEGICVNSLSPGLTMSGNVRQNVSWSDEIASKNIASRALKREALPDDLVGALLFLASPASDFITGQTLSVDGGSVMN